MRSDKKMNLKKFISAAVGAAMLCASLPTGTVVNFTEDTPIAAPFEF